MIAAHLPIASDTVSIIDLETTGLSAAAGERIVEISIVKIPPAKPPVVVFDTLVNPGGPVRGTSIHGITDDDVVGAPSFAEIAGEILTHVEGTVLATYNASFDMAFLRSEYSIASRGDHALELPYLCLMWLRPQLGLGQRCTLTAACAAHGIAPGDHSARADAVAAAQLWARYEEAARRDGVATFGHWRQGRRGKFWESLALPLPARAQWPWRASAPPTLKPRETAAAAPRERPVPVDRAAARRAYWHALLDVMEDLAASAWEVVALQDERQRLGLDEADVRAVHAKFFGNRLEALAADQRITREEDEELRRVHQALRRLGWAPGV